MADESESIEKAASVVYQRWILSDIEAGITPDGYSLHSTIEEHARFVKEQWHAQRRDNSARGRPIDETPTVYTACDGQPEWVECTQAVATLVKNSGGTLRGRDRWTRVDAQRRLLTKIMDEPMPPAESAGENSRAGMFRAVEAEIEEIILNYEKEGADQAVIMTALLSVLGSRVPGGITNEEAVRLVGALTAQPTRTNS